MSTTFIVRSLLENDFYKLTMWQAFFHRYANVHARYAFVCRQPPLFPLALLKDAVERELDHFCTLSLTQDELVYLLTLSLLTADFIHFLAHFRFQRHLISVCTEGDRLVIEACGPIIDVIGFEIFVLYIVSELYHQRFSDAAHDLDYARQRLQEQIAFIKIHRDDLQHETEPFLFFDFGLRRRYCTLWHEEMLETLLRAVPEHCLGTSDVYLAKKYGIPPVGTLAHEYLQAYQVLAPSLRHFQKKALEDWLQEYPGQFNIAITDVVTMDAFLADFDVNLARSFSGLRHDSGDPIIWGEKAIAYYHAVGLAPLSKRLIFSNSLDIPQAIDLYNYFKGRVLTSFGIGSQLSNGTPHRALNIVMKMVSCQNQPVAKVTDSAAKTICRDDHFLRHLRRIFCLPPT